MLKEHFGLKFILHSPEPGPLRQQTDESLQMQNMLNFGSFIAWPPHSRQQRKKGEWNVTQTTGIKNLQKQGL